MRRSACPGGMSGPWMPADPDVALDRSAALGHTVGLGALDVPVLDQAGLAKDIGGKDRPLSADTNNQDIETAAHFFPSRTIAAKGQRSAQTAQPLQSSLIRAFSSANSIAGQPNRTQVPQPVQASVSTMYLPRFTPVRFAMITHICLAMITLTPLRFFASCRRLTMPGDIVRVDGLDKGGTAGAADRIQRDRRALDPAGSCTGVRVRLVAGHRGDPVVEDDHGHVRTIVDRIQQALDTRVEERGVPDGADDIPGFSGMGDTARHRDGCTHADRRVNRPELEPERVAPDVARVDGILVYLFDRIERAAVQAAGTEDRRAGGDIRHRRDSREGIFGEEPGLLHDRCNRGRRQFSLVGGIPVLLAKDRHGPGNLPDDLLDFRCQFLDDEDLLVLPDETGQPVLIDRVGSDLHERDTCGKQFLNIGCTDTTCDDGGLPPDLDTG